MSTHLHISVSPIENESRIFRAVSSISRHYTSDTIHINGIWKPGIPEKEEFGERVIITRFKISPRGVRGFKNILFFKDWKKAIINHWQNKELSIVHCHSILDLRIGVVLKKQHNCKLVYDAHELETERNGLSGIKKLFEKHLEKNLIKQVDETIVVNESIAKWYRNKYPEARITVVRNIARFHKVQESKIKPDYFRYLFNIPPEALVFIYLGSLQKGRGIEMLIRLFTAKRSHHIVFIGYGPLKTFVKEASLASFNVHFHEKVPEDQVVDVASKADIGLSLIENTCLSYYYCLPNKIYEYLYAGIPVLCSNFPEMKALLEKFNAGWTTGPDYNSVEQTIAAITREKINDVRKNLKGIQIEQWETEENILISIYQRLTKDDSYN